MDATHRVATLKSAVRRGIFPPELSFILHIPLRNILLSPQKLAARLDLAPASHVLEVGAGSGFYSVEVAREVPRGHLELLDLQPEMIKKARRKLDAKGLSNTGFMLADAGRLPFKDDSLNVVFLVTVFGEIADQRSFLSEAHRVLKSGGILSISEHLPDPDFSPFAIVKSMVEQEGFEFFKSYGRKWSYTVNFRKPEVVS